MARKRYFRKVTNNLQYLILCTYSTAKFQTIIPFFGGPHLRKARSIFCVNVSENYMNLHIALIEKKLSLAKVELRLSGAL